MDKITGDERMIDTNKYEGHTEGLWCWKDGNIVRKAIGNTPLTDDAGLYLIADKHLIADAPLLLAEVKRLRKENDVLAEAIKEDNEILKKHIETLAEVKRLREGIKQLRRYVHRICKTHSKNIEGDN